MTYGGPPVRAPYGHGGYPPWGYAPEPARPVFDSSTPEERAAKREESEAWMAQWWIDHPPKCDVDLSQLAKQPLTNRTTQPKKDRT